MRPHAYIRQAKATKHWNGCIHPCTIAIDIDAHVCTVHSSLAIWKVTSTRRPTWQQRIHCLRYIRHNHISNHWPTSKLCWSTLKQRIGVQRQKHAINADMSATDKESMLFKMGAHYTMEQWYRASCLIHLVLPPDGWWTIQRSHQSDHQLQKRRSEPLLSNLSSTLPNHYTQSTAYDAFQRHA